jgi:hypothetical protein
MSASGGRFAVGYPEQGRVSIYEFNDDDLVLGDGDERNASTNWPKIKLLDEVYSETPESGDLFGRSLSMDFFGKVLVVGARGYVQDFWYLDFGANRVSYVPTQTGPILGDEADGEGFGTVVSIGGSPKHMRLICPTCSMNTVQVIQGQRVAVSSPKYDNGRGRVLLFQFSADTSGRGDGRWERIASPIVGSTGGEGFGHDVRMSTGSMSVIVSSKTFSGGRAAGQNGDGAVNAYQIRPLGS